MYSRAFQNIDIQTLSNVRFYDLPNMLGQLTSHLHEFQLQDQLLQNGEYIGKIITQCFHRLEKLIASKYFTNLVKTIKGTDKLFRNHDYTSLDRLFVKKNTDLKQGKQISVNNLADLLPYPLENYVVQTDIKKINIVGKKQIPIYCDVDFLMIHAIMELLFFCRYNKNFIQYIVVGSGDKDYSEICRMAKDQGILVVSVSFMGEGLSVSTIQNSDIVFILYPTLCIVKPYRYCLEELMHPQ